MNPKIFRAYDIRGRYPSEINEKIVEQIAQCLGRYFQSAISNQQSAIKVVIGHDARLSSPNLYKAVIKGIMNYELGIGGKKDVKKTIIHNSKFIILPIGLATTPMFYFLVNHLKADAGIMITASHNPKNYNGLKVVGKNAIPISGKEILKLI